MKKRNNKGFTMAELLIVVAIIAVLVAASVPVFSSQLEKAREATDANNIRAAYAAVQAAGLSHESNDDIEKMNTADITYSAEDATAGKYSSKAVVTLKQTQDGWQSGDQDIGGISIPTANAKAKGTATIEYKEETGTTTITMSP